MVQDIALVATQTYLINSLSSSDISISFKFILH